MKSRKVIGIDLGTTNSCVAVFDVISKQPLIIENKEGTRTTPSVVSFNEDGSHIVGAPAQKLSHKNIGCTIYAVKRLMGMEYSKVADFKLSYKIVNDNNRPYIDIRGKKHSPVEISSMILYKIKSDVSKYFNEDITQAVITVPAYFNDSQRQATKDAGLAAGLNVLRIINEPTAAALMYGSQNKVVGNILVYDLGGGTFDVSVLNINQGVYEVLATEGDSHLGGEDFDNLIVNEIKQQIFKEHKNHVSDTLSLYRIKEAAENVKKQLSSSESADINLPYITLGKDKVINVELTITRARFEYLISDLVNKTLGTCDAVLTAARLQSSDLSHIILVGGQTRTPCISAKLEARFGIKPMSNISPDEVVAAGAAIQGSIIAGTTQDMLLLDVLPLSVGIETQGGVFSKLIERNTTIPAKRTNIYSTAENNQTAVTIRVLQGERPLAKDNHELGLFNLEGIEAAPRGVPQIEVSFEVDANGIMHVAAQDKKTGKSHRIEISPSVGLSEQEREDMLKKAEEFKEQDKIVETKIQLLNKKDTLKYRIQDILETKKLTNVDFDNIKDEKVDMSSEVSHIENHISQLESILQGLDTESGTHESEESESQSPETQEVNVEDSA